MTSVPEPLDEKGARVPKDTGFEEEAKPAWRGVVLLMVIVGLVLAIAYLFPSHLSRGRLQEISDQIRSFGLVAPLILTLGVALLVGLGFPRLVFCAIAGMALGFWQGLLWAQLGTLLGNYGVFLLARRGARDWAQRYLSKRGKMHKLIRRESISGVILARQLPLPGMIVNLGCGLFPIRHRDYLLGTIIGQLPAAIPCTLIGAGALQASPAKSAGMITLAVIAAVVAWAGLRRLLRGTHSKSASN